LDAALVVFGTKGFHAANVSDVAAHAGVSQGTIYWYFESKDAILETLVTEGFREFVQPFMDMLEASDQSPVERLRLTLREALSWARMNSEQLRLLLQLWSQPALTDSDSGLASILEEVYGGQIMAPLGRIIGEAMELGEIAPGDVEALTLVTAALVDGLMLYMLMWPDAIVPQDRLEVAALRILQPLSQEGEV
jgi:TetR/AcrR family acrAB operon transcriptional repressor